MVAAVSRLATPRGSLDEGHNTAAMRASVESALHAAADLDATEIIVSTIGPTVILEGFVSQ